MAEEQVPNGQPAEQPVAQAPQDISSKTIVVLVLLALVVSFIGAWVNIQQAMYIGDIPEGKSTANVASAQVAFELNPPPEPKVTAATGKVTLGISEAP